MKTQTRFREANTWGRRGKWRFDHLQRTSTDEQTILNLNSVKYGELREVDSSGSARDISYTVLPAGHNPENWMDDRANSDEIAVALAARQNQATAMETDHAG